MGYAPDVFGLNRRQVESAQAQIENQPLQLEATYMTLASNVVAAALQEASLRAQLEAVQRIVALNQEQLDILYTQYRLGYIAEWKSLLRNIAGKCGAITNTAQEATRPSA